MRRIRKKMKQKHVNNSTHQKELVYTEQTRYSKL